MQTGALLLDIHCCHGEIFRSLSSLRMYSQIEMWSHVTIESKMEE